MGLLTGLLTLPLAPVRGVALIAEQLSAEARRQLVDDEANIMRALASLQHAEEHGEITSEQYFEEEELLIERLARLRNGPAATMAAQEAVRDQLRGEPR